VVRPAIIIGLADQLVEDPSGVLTMLTPWISIQRPWTCGTGNASRST
jgi:hypothetical protein